MATKLIPLKYTMKIHQVVAVEMFLVKHRELSCFCQDGKCDCYSPILHSFEINEHHSIITEEILDEVTGIIHSKVIKKMMKMKKCKKTIMTQFKLMVTWKKSKTLLKYRKHIKTKKYREM